MFGGCISVNFGGAIRYKLRWIIVYVTAAYVQAFELYNTNPSAPFKGSPVNAADPYLPLDYELLLRAEGEKESRVAHDTYSFGLTVPRYNLELFQSGENCQLHNRNRRFII